MSAFPDEIWQDIISRATHVPGAYNDQPVDIFDTVHQHDDLRSRISASTATKLALSSVSRAFYHITQCYLFEIIPLRTLHQLDKLAYLLDTSSTHRELVGLHAKMVDLSIRDVDGVSYQNPCILSREDALILRDRMWKCRENIRKIHSLCRSMEHQCLDFPEYQITWARVVSSLPSDCVRGHYPSGQGFAFLYPATLRSLEYNMGLDRPQQDFRLQNLHTISGSAREIHFLFLEHAPSLQCVMLTESTRPHAIRDAHRMQIFIRQHGSGVQSLVLQKLECRDYIGMTMHDILPLVATACPGLKDLTLDMRCVLADSDMATVSSVERVGLLCAPDDAVPRRFRLSNIDVHQWDYLFSWFLGTRQAAVFPSLKVVRLFSPNLTIFLSTTYPQVLPNWSERFRQAGVALEDEQGRPLGPDGGGVRLEPYRNP